MINITDLKFSTESDEGKMLLAAIAMMTSNPEWSHKIVGDVVEEISNMANRIYYEKEWEADKFKRKRSDILDTFLPE